MPTTIFFSWQADTPTKEGRNLIERALERAEKSIGDDTGVEEAVRDLEIDRDTKGVPGTPPIVETIFRKIDNAAVFVPDLTFVGKRLDGRPTPNPNVLVEYGWALKSLTHSRILPVMNTAFGKPTSEAMPFDMIHLRRPTLYDCPIGASEDIRRQQREALAKELEEKLLAIFKGDDFKRSRPAELILPPFVRQLPMDGPGRFRSQGEPLGIVERSFEEIKLSDGPAMWLRLMPHASPGRDWFVSDLRTVVSERGVRLLLRHPAGGYGHFRAHDGFGMYYAENTPGETRDMAFIFTTGEIWTIDTSNLEYSAHDNAIPFVESDFRDALTASSEVLAKLGIDPPFTWIAGMEKVKGRGLYVPDRPGYSSIFPGTRGKCLQDNVIGEGQHIPGDEPAASLKPFFTKLFDSCGLERPTWLDSIRQ